jgi:hypothetical protein
MDLSIVNSIQFKSLIFLLICLFLLRLKYKEFWTDFFHTSRSHNIYINIFCFDFSETFKY